MWDINHLAAFIGQLSAQHLLAQRVSFQLLLVDLDHRICAGIPIIESSLRAPIPLTNRVAFRRPSKEQAK